MKQRIGRPGTRQVLVPLQPGSGGFGLAPRVSVHNGLTCIEVDVSVPFGPLGLFLWGWQDGQTYVHDIRSMNWVEGLASAGRIPARYFGVGKSFTEMQALAAAGELQQAVRAEQMLEMHEVPHGGRIGVAIEGPFVDACFWGLTYENQQPLISAELGRLPPDGETSDSRQPPRVLWRGKVIQHRLLADETVADVTAESEASAVALLELCARPWRNR